MRVELRFNDDQVKKALEASYKRHIRMTIENNVSALSEAIKKAYATKVKMTSEYKSLVLETGILRRDLGLENSSEVMAELIDTLINSVEVKVNKAINEQKTYMIPLTITLFNNNTLKNLLSSDFASYESVGANGSHEIPWLSWLLTAGRTPVVIGYQVSMPQKRFDKTSRTWRTIMIKGGSFKMDSRFAGTKNKNFLVDAAVNMEKDIKQIVYDKIIRKF